MKILQWIFDNIDTALAIVLSAVAAIFGIFGIFQAALLPALAGTLALLAVSIIRDRNGRGLLTDQIQKLELTLTSIQSKSGADTFFTTKTSEKVLISRAREDVWLIQETGSKIIEENLKPLADLIKRGGSVKLILPSSDPKIIDIIAIRNKTLDVTSFVSRQKDAKVKIERLFESIKGLSGSLEVRYIDYPLDTTTVFTDPESPATVYREGMVRMVGFKNFFDDKRDFTIAHRFEPETYEHFVQQFREMWKLSKEQDSH